MKIFLDTAEIDEIRTAARWGILDGVTTNPTLFSRVGGSYDDVLGSAELGVPFLGDVPFDAEIVREGDVGTPTLIARAGSHAAASFDRIAQRVAEALGWRRIAANR